MNDRAASTPQPFEHGERNREHFLLLSPKQSAPSAQSPLALVRALPGELKDLVCPKLRIATDIEHCIFHASISHRKRLFFAQY